MTIRTLISKLNDEKPNSFGNERLISFVNEVEAEVAEQLSVDFDTYTAADMDRELLALKPYDRLYVSYVKAMVDYANEEYESYTNNQAQHVQDFRDFVDWIVRTSQVTENTFPRRLRNTL